MALTITTAAPLRRVEPSRLAHVGPNWFATVMGTAIVSVAAATTPVAIPGADAVALLFWALATALLVVVSTASVLHRRRHPVAARAHLRHRVMGHFWGAPPMAAMAVGAATLLAGRDVVGTPVAVGAGVALWLIGTAGGLATLVVVPLVQRSAGQLTADDAFAGWLMPVVPPMVSAATGPLLLPHLPAAVRPALVDVCIALFVAAILASAVVIVVVVRRVVRLGVGPAALVPTLCIVLGPLGQSVTAAHHLGVALDHVALGVAYGLPIAAVALGWLGFCAVVVARTARSGLPFGLPWWSFTFPVGTVVTGTGALADATGSGVLAATSVALLAVLLGAWCVVATRTVAGVRAGVLLAPPGAAPAG